MSQSPLNLIESLGRVEHFKRFPEAARTEIVNAGQIRAFPAGSLIFREGEPSTGMFVLFKGHVHLCKAGPQGQQSIVAEIEPVIMFNEVTVLDHGPNLTTALALHDCMTWNISFENFQALLQRYPIVGTSLLRVLAKRTRNLLSQYEDLSFRSVVARTAKLLLDLSEHGTVTIDRKAFTNADMASKISTVPEALSRSLKILKKNGDIVCTRAAIKVKQPQTLEKFAQIEQTLY